MARLQKHASQSELAEKIDEDHHADPASIDTSFDEQDHEDVNTQHNDKESVRSNSIRHEQAKRSTKKLRRLELVALVTCIIGPLLGAWLLHAVRAYLSRPSEGLVSNFSLLIFVLAAELRILIHLCRLMLTHTVHLQRVLAESSPVPSGSYKISKLNSRVEKLEQSLADAAAIAKESSRPLVATSLMQENQKLREQTSSDADLARVIAVAVTPQLRRLQLETQRVMDRTHALAILVEARLEDVRVRVERLEQADAFQDMAVHYGTRHRRGLGRKWVGMVGKLQWIAANAWWLCTGGPVWRMFGQFTRLIGDDKKQISGKAHSKQRRHPSSPW